MARGINKVILVGNVGGQPEIRLTQNGDEIANFSFATNDRWKDKKTGELRKKTEWQKIVVFSTGLIKIIKNYIIKGSKLYIEGSLQTREYVDKDSNNRYVTEVILKQYNSVLVMLDTKKDYKDFDKDINDSNSSNISDVPF